MKANIVETTEARAWQRIGRLAQNVGSESLADKIRNHPIVVVGVAFVSGFTLCAVLTDRLLIEPRKLRIQELEVAFEEHQRRGPAAEQTESAIPRLSAELDAYEIRTWATPSGDLSMRLLHIVPATHGHAAQVQWNAIPPAPAYLHEGDTYDLLVGEDSYRVNVERVDRNQVSLALFRQ